MFKNYSNIYIIQYKKILNINLKKKKKKKKKIFFFKKKIFLKKYKKF